ncbi:P2Y purinoceptor 14-like [Solea solea]|uniref:P2Y purinoceptor 14-like n=1 Tax=Solea solea TaxID=90069 RepID=UPI00272CF7DC|nr:P2Y purinoceptor 14-like [Solea solea]
MVKGVHRQPSVVCIFTTEMSKVDSTLPCVTLSLFSVQVGLLLNGITLNFYFCRARQHKTSSVTVYLKNLAAADFLISLCLPLRILNHASISNWVYCSFGSPVFYLNMYASILFMGYIAANRYLKIVNPRGTLVFRTVRAAHVTSTVTWVILIAMMSAYTLLSLLTKEEGSSDPVGMSCDVLQSKPLRLFYKTIHIICATIFLLVLLSLVFFYYSTSRMLSLAQQRQPASSSSKKLTKSRRNMLVLVSVFCVCFIPYHLVRLPYAFLSKQFKCNLFFYLKELTIMVSVLNICLDPLIYFMFCKAFRTQLRASKSSFRTTQDVTQVGRVERRSSAGWMTVRMKTDTCDL